MGELDKNDLVDPPKQVIVDIKLGRDDIVIRFSASLKTRASKVSTYTGPKKMDTWEWMAGKVAHMVNGEVAEITDTMYGETICESTSSPAVLTILMVESWLVNHGENWAFATTDATRDLSGKVLPAPGSPQEIEA